MNNGQIFIAEIKTKSPFGFHSECSFNRRMEIAIEFGDWISVHDNALWGGDFEAISYVRKYTNKPILAKGLHTTNDDIIRALDHGADYVLVVDRIIHCGFGVNDKKLLFEISEFNVMQQLAKEPSKENLKYVYNSRNLKTGRKKEREELDNFLNLGLWTCQASGIKDISDVDIRAKAFIVGENLVDFCYNRK